LFSVWLSPDTSESRETGKEGDIPRCGPPKQAKFRLYL